jgi:hypothetical protein
VAKEKEIMPGDEPSAFKKLVDVVGQAQALNQANQYILLERDIARSKPDGNKYLADMFERISARADKFPIAGEAHPVIAEFRLTISTFFSLTYKIQIRLDGVKSKHHCDESGLRPFPFQFTSKPRLFFDDFPQQAMGNRLTRISGFQLRNSIPVRPPPASYLSRILSAIRSSKIYYCKLAGAKSMIFGQPNS